MYQVVVGSVFQCWSCRHIHIKGNKIQPFTLNLSLMAIPDYNLPMRSRYVYDLVQRLLNRNVLLTRWWCLIYVASDQKLFSIFLYWNNNFLNKSQTISRCRKTSKVHQRFHSDLNPRYKALKLITSKTNFKWLSHMDPRFNVKIFKNFSEFSQWLISNFTYLLLA